MARTKKSEQAVAPAAPQAQPKLSAALEAVKAEHAALRKRRDDWALKVQDTEFDYDNDVEAAEIETHARNLTELAKAQRDLEGFETQIRNFLTVESGK